jgi:2'-5' RNA ligase
MRLFVAVELPKEVQEYLAELQNQFKGFGRLNLVKPEKIHLTLKFLGEVEESKIDNVKKELSQIKFRKTNAELSKLGVFPNENYVRVLWAGLKENKELQELAKAVSERLQNVRKDDYEFKSHLTIARVKHLKDKQGFLKQLKSVEIKPLKFKVDNFKLIKSTLTEQGPIYEVLEEFKSGLY